MIVPPCLMGKIGEIVGKNIVCHFPMQEHLQQSPIPVWDPMTSPLLIRLLPSDEASGDCPSTGEDQR
jgi:hypothetical protein